MSRNINITSPITTGTLVVKKLEHAAGLPLPAYQTKGSAGMDLTAAIDDDETIIIRPGKRTLVPTGLILAIPAGYEGQIRPRSGLANKHGVTVLNAPGTIDSDYRGEVKVMLVNLGDQDFEIECGDRIAQLVIAPYVICEVAVNDNLGDTERGSGGFGSTGV